MWKGCLLLVLLFVAIAYTEFELVQARDLPYPWVVAVVLALCLSLALGSVQGLVQAWRARSRPETSRADWREGELVRVGGVLKPIGQCVTVPFSGREVLIGWYEGLAARPDLGDVNLLRPRWRGMVAAPCVLETPGGRIALSGFPTLKHVSQQRFDDRAHVQQAARHLANTPWRVAPDIVSVDFAQAERAFAAEGGALPVHLINRTALDQLEMTIQVTTEAELRERLGRLRWLYSERVLAPGDVVTMVATYRSNPARLDIGHDVAGAQHAVFPGRAAALVSAQWRQALVFALVLALIAAAAHHVAYSSEGALYRSMLEFLRLGG